MKLNEGRIGHTYLVKSVVVDDTITRRLEALGVNEVTPVTILNKKGSGSVIFKVRGTRLAVGRRISDGIEIQEAGGEATSRSGTYIHEAQLIRARADIHRKEDESHGEF